MIIFCKIVLLRFIYFSYVKQVINFNLLSQITEYNRIDKHHGHACLYRAKWSELYLSIALDCEIN